MTICRASRGLAIGPRGELAYRRRGRYGRHGDDRAAHVTLVEPKLAPRPKVNLVIVDCRIDRIAPIRRTWRRLTFVRQMPSRRSITPALALVGADIW